MGVLDGWKYCPRCGSEVRTHPTRVECPACGYAFWANPVPGAEAVCFDERGRILLGLRAFEPAAGMWDLPGGFVEEGELPLDALRREIREETGREPEPVEFLGMWNEPYDGRIVLCLTWIARLDDDVCPGDDLVELRWFEPEELPRDRLAFTHYDDALSRALRRQQDA